MIFGFVGAAVVSRVFGGFAEGAFGAVIDTADAGNMMMMRDTGDDEVDMPAPNSEVDTNLTNLLCEDFSRAFNHQSETGIFTDFKYFSLNEDEESKVFLDGALKLTRTTYRSQFRFRARISRPCDFDRITRVLKEEHKMVRLEFQIYFIHIFHIHKKGINTLYLEIEI